MPQITYDKPTKECKRGDVHTSDLELIMGAKAEGGAFFILRTKAKAGEEGLFRHTFYIQYEQQPKPWRARLIEVSYSKALEWYQYLSRQRNINPAMTEEEGFGWYKDYLARINAR